MASTQVKWGEVSLLSLGLLLGAGENASSQETPVPKPVSPLTAAVASIASPTKLHTNEIEKSSVGIFDGRQIFGFRTTTGAISCIRFQEVDLTFSPPWTGSSLAPVLTNLSPILQRLHEEMPSDTYYLETADGFLFRLEQHETDEDLACLPHGVFRITHETHQKGNTADVHAAMRLCAEIRNDAVATLIPAERAEFESMCARLFDETKLASIRSRIGEEMQTYSKLPYRYEQFTQDSQNFEKLLSNRATHENFKGALSSYESAYGVTNEDVSRHCADKTLEICRRILISEILNTRYSNVIQALQSTTDTKQLKALDSEWQTALDTFGAKRGFARWDSARYQTDRFNTSASSCEAVLKRWEESLKIEPNRTLAGLNAKVRQVADDLKLTQGQTPDALHIDLLRYRDGSAPEHISYRRDLGASRETQIRFHRGSASRQEVWRSGSHTIYDINELEQSAETINTETGLRRRYDRWKRDEKRWNLVQYREFRSDGTPSVAETLDDGRCTLYDKEGKTVAILEYSKDGAAIERRWLYSPAGEAISTWDIEQSRTPGLTADQYLANLRKTLTTPERFYWYLELCMKYTPEDVDLWQTPQQTVQRIQNKRMAGDCDDYAFLARAHLRGLGYKAHVLYLPNHAECVWLTTDAAGRYYGWSLGTFGLDCNGVRYCLSEPAAPQKGFATAREAIQSLMRKYENGGLGLSAGAKVDINPDQIQIMENNAPNSQQKYTVGLDHILRQ